MEHEIPSNKRGYLNSDFLLFHLKDQNTAELEPHYHEFYKIIVFISGKVTYLIEGKAYTLKPSDILFVSKNDIHKAQIDNSEIYERIVLWMSKDFLDKESSKKAPLYNCFNVTAEKKSKLMRLNLEPLNNTKSLLNKLASAYKSTDFGHDLLAKALFIQLMIYLNRYCIKDENINVEFGVNSDERINAILDFINYNLDGDLSSDTIAQSFYMSKYNLLHKFKNLTGYTLHNYILKKRLMKAKILLQEGKSVGDTCILCGFGDYSNFIRAYKNMYGRPPKKSIDI
jgi:AraC-like DNA-binding protein